VSSPSPTVEQLLAVLGRSHERLVKALAGLTEEDLTSRSYDEDWSIAQVASHLGSSAEIFGTIVEAGLTNGPAPGVEQFQPVWDRWNVKSPAAQAADAVQADGAFLDRLEGLPADEAQRWRMDLFGADQDLTGLLHMRLSEHAVHTWDIVVALDPAATLSADAVEILVDNLAGTVGHVGKPTQPPHQVLVTTREPDHRFVLTVDGDSVHLDPAPADVGSSERLTMTAEAFIRLVYGRLDPEHTPESVDASGTDLDDLRRAFPGL
jgi:uncharacterized protein (TIGR03083 family)